MSRKRSSSLVLAEIVCDGSAYTWQNGRCARVRFLLRSEAINTIERVDLRGVFGVDRCGFAEWMAIYEAAKRLREMILSRHEKVSGYMLLIHSDCRPVLNWILSERISHNKETRKNKNRTVAMLQQFGGYSLHWQPREYINQILGS